MKERKQKAGAVDLNELKRTHPNDPRIGQGYNDARGEIEDDENPVESKNVKNSRGPAQKRT